MFRLMLVALLFSDPEITSAVAHSTSPRFCVQEESIRIERVVSRIHIMGEDSKHSTISLLMPVNCEDGKYLKPDTLAQALRWLDMALPIDYKAGLLKDNTYLHSPYGGSADRHIATFLQNHWLLVKRNPVCAEAWAAMAEAGEPVDWSDEEIAYCGPDLLDLLRKRLLMPSCAIPEGNKGFSEPSGCVPLPEERSNGTND